MSKKIIFSAGGTGGHINPAINLMKHFFDKGYTVILVTDYRGKNFIDKYPNFKSYILKLDTPTNKNLFKKVVAALVILYSIIKSFIILKKEKPDLIFGLGGYASFPISFASKFLSLPLVIYENNSIFGRANRYLSSISKKIFLANKILRNVPINIKNKIYEIGPILNKNIINNKVLEKKDNNDFSILVLGGSQGAKIFGKVIPQVIKKISDEGYKIKIIQQCLVNQKAEIENFYKYNNISNYIFEYEENILKFICDSNLAITRSGASTTAELVYTNTPFIAIPLPSSIDNHQYLNAKYYENKGCCLLLEQNNFNINSLYNLIINLIKNKNNLDEIKKNMKNNRKYDTYSLIEKEIIEYIKK